MSAPHGQRPLFGKCAWVAGASRGIGRAIAVALARAGAVTCLGARPEDALAHTAALCGEHAASHAITLDVAQWSSAESFAAKALELAGPPSILINNAGVGLFQDFETMAPADFDRMVDVNLRGPWYMARTAVPLMKSLGAGHIINISSVAGKVGFKRGTAYCAAKAGLNAMSECLMLEMREHGIKVSVIAPGSVETRFHQDALPSANVRDNSWMLAPEQIADAVLHVLLTPPGMLTNYYEVRPLTTGKG